MREEKRSSRPEEAGGKLDALFDGLREECAAPPAAHGFLAGFRARREAWLERADQAAPWRLLALRLSPVGALAAGAALVMDAWRPRTGHVPGDCSGSSGSRRVPGSIRGWAGRGGCGDRGDERR